VGPALVTRVACFWLPPAASSATMNQQRSASFSGPLASQRPHVPPLVPGLALRPRSPSRARAIAWFRFSEINRDLQDHPIVMVVTSLVPRPPPTVHTALHKRRLGSISRLSPVKRWLRSGRRACIFLVNYKRHCPFVALQWHPSGSGHADRPPLSPRSEPHAHTRPALRR